MVSCSICKSTLNTISHAIALDECEPLSPSHVSVTLCTGRSKSKVHPASCEGLARSGSLKLDAWTDERTFRYRCDDHAARVLSAKGVCRKSGLNYFGATSASGGATEERDA